MVLDNGFVKVTQKVIYDAKKTQRDGVTRIKLQHFEISDSCFFIFSVNKQRMMRHAEPR